MNWSKIYSGLKSIAALSGLMAFFGFAFSFYQDVQIKQSVVDQGWQETEIYRVVVDAGVDGIKFEKIVSEVQSAYFSSGSEQIISAGVAKQNSVRRGLIGLAAKNSIVRDTEGNYIVPAVARNYLTQDLLFSRRQQLDEKAFNLVMENPGRYDSHELRNKLVEDAGATPREAWQTNGTALFMQPPAFVPFEDFQYRPESKLKVLE